MSFKKRIIDYCEVNGRIGCSKCVFKVPCDRANDEKIPRNFKPQELEIMEQEIYQHMKHMSAELNILAKFMADVSRDKLAELDSAAGKQE